VSEDNTKDGDGTNTKDGTGAPVPPPPTKLREVVVQLPPKREVSAEHLEQLHASGLTDETIALAALYTELHSVRIAELLKVAKYTRASGGILVFPFFRPGEAAPHAYRLRPTYPRIIRKGKGKERVVKYEQPEGSASMVFFAPRARASGNYRSAEPKLWTEGEKKALALDQEGCVCVGLTGVWNWVDAAKRPEHALHPEIVEHVLITGCDHVIVFDNDASANDRVMKAAQTLAGVLLAAGARSVKFVTPPPGKHKGIDDYYAAHGGDAVRALIASAADIEPIDPRQPLQRVRSIKAMREAPVPEALVMPLGYELQKDGSLWREAVDEKHGAARIAPSPIFITRHLVDHYTGDARFDLAFETNQRWHSACVSRKAVVDARTMVAELGPIGAPVTSNSASKIVDWLEDFERVNASIIERIDCVAQTGWHRIAGVRTFVSHEPITADQSKPLVALDTRGDRKKMFGSLAPRGTFEAHLAALKRAWSADPVCAAMIAAALAATLLEPLGATNFAVHLVGESSRGKTSMLKIAASIFGDPNSPQWLASWNVTASGAELRASILNDLPQCYDEIGGGDPQAAERQVYALINGGGRTRAQRDLSLRETVSWRTVVLSTGERELADESNATGAQVRVIQVPVNGFGMLNAADVDALRAECAAHCGQFGQAWIETLLAIEDWAPYRDALAKLTKTLRLQTKDALQGRVASYFGVLALAEVMAAELGLGSADGSTMIRLFGNTSQREAIAGLGERARDAVEQWVLSDPEAFPELEANPLTGEDPKKSHGATRARHGFRRPDGAVLIIPAELKAFCLRNGLAQRAVIREWIKLGWVEHDAARLDKQVKVGGKNLRFTYLKPQSEMSADAGSI
jgi:hypothetical protein